MKTWLITLATLAVFCIPSPGSAAPPRPGPYFTVFLGAAMPEDVTVSSYDYYYGDAFSDKVEFDTGVYSGFTGGYDFGFLRMEGELSYRYNEIKSITDQFSGLKLQAVNGDIGAFATMFNVFFDMHNSTPVTPYIGGGIGFASLHLGDTTGDYLLIYGSGDDTVFASQFGGGLDIALNRNMSLDLGYRYFITEDAQFESYSPISTNFKYESHNVLVGFKFKF